MHITQKTLIQTLRKLLLFLLISSLYLEANQQELDRLSQEIFVTQEQRRMLLERYQLEKEKYFNNRTINSYIKTMNQLRDKEIALIKRRNFFALEKNRLIQMQRTQRIEQEKIRREERFLARQAKQKEARREQQEAKEREQQKALEKKRVATMRGNITVKIDLSDQKMNVYKGKHLLYTWLVSTARRGYVTPKGNYRPYHLTKMHYSRKYDNSPMPHSIFFKGGYAIHGTNSVKSLGKRASHGCIRLHKNNAKKLYNLIKSHGYKKTSIKIRA